MKKLIFLLIASIFLMIPNSVSALPLSCKSCALLDMDSGRILYEKSKDEPRLIASITKIMTAVIAIENMDLNKEIVVGDEVLKMYGSNIYIVPGDRIKLRDLLYGLLLRSGNDSAVVIAKNVAGSEEEFVNLMNKKAKDIGMKNTVFNNPHGLDEETENKSSAYDMALLSTYANTLDEYRKISGTYKWNVKVNDRAYIWYNRNKLLKKYSYATGGKTGYTPRAGRTLVTTASKGGLNLTAVSLNDGNEYEDHKSLYEYAFNSYSNYKIVDKKTFRLDNEYYNDEIYIKHSFSYPLTEKELKKVRILAKIYKLKKYKNHDIVGELKVLLGDNVIFSDPIYVRVKSKKSFLDKLKKIFS